MRMKKTRSSLILAQSLDALREISSKKRVERPVLLNISINQTATAKELLDKVQATAQELLLDADLGNLVVYYQTDKNKEKKLKINLIVAGDRRLEEIGVSNTTELTA
jgi:hypothetical protein